MMPGKNTGPTAREFRAYLVDQRDAFEINAQRFAMDGHAAEAARSNNAAVWLGNVIAELDGFLEGKS